MWESLMAGFTLGVLGSLHCVGMCGPIALALPVHRFTPFKKYLAIFLYHAGRTFTYMLLGLLFSTISGQLFIGDYQRYLSICIGLVILLVMLFPKVGYTMPLYRKFVSKIQNSLSVRLNAINSAGVFAILGFLNGWLPCGLVYIALSAAFAIGDPLKGTVFMSGFGMGTWPLLILVIIAGKKLAAEHRLRLKNIMPILITGMALLFILRGLNLGIPYLSPKIEQTGQETHAACCHH